MENIKKTSNIQKPLNGMQAKQEIRRQVYVIAETILHIAKSVEEALVNITAVKEVLNQITDKLNRDQFICQEEKDLLELAEKWLSEEKVDMSPGTTDKTIRCLNLKQISALGDSFLSASTDSATCSSHLDTPPVTNRFSVGSTQTLNEGQELDWDGHGMELHESIHSTYSGATTAFKDPYTMCSHIESESATEIDVPKSCSYNGIYEEEMEFTLEVEEGFYSDVSSTDDCFQDSLPHNDFSPQADSGVTQLDSNNSTDRSMSCPDTDLITVQTPPNYDRDINTWDTFATVNLEEDVFSVASSANSNTSTPMLCRKQRVTIPTLSHSCIPDSPQPRVLAQVAEVSNSLVVPTTTSATRLRASSLGEYQLRAKSADSSMWRSSPKLTDKETQIKQQLSDTCPAMAGGCDTDESATSTDSAAEKSDSSKSSLSSSCGLPSVLSDNYDTSCVMLPAALHKNNYYHKCRKAVFV